MNKRKKIIVYFSVGLAALFIIVVITISSIQDQRPGNSHDGRRAADIKQISTGLELYHQARKEYPPVEPGCQNTDVLGDYFVPNWTPKMPQERFISDGHPPYQFAISSDGDSFVVKATFYEQRSKLDQKRLDEDLDGIILGCNCDDPNYCVGSTNLAN